MANTPKSSRSAGGQRPEDHVPNRTEHDVARQKAPRPQSGESDASNPSRGGGGVEENRNHPKNVEHPGTSTDSTKGGWGQG